MAKEDKQEKRKFQNMGDLNKIERDIVNRYRNYLAQGFGSITLSEFEADTFKKQMKKVVEFGNTRMLRMFKRNHDEIMEKAKAMKAVHVETEKALDELTKLIK